MMLGKEVDVLTPLKGTALRKAPTFFAVALVVLAWFSNDVALAWIHERVPRDTPPLPDLFFSFFPEIDGAIRVAEYILLTILINVFLVMFLHRHRWHVLRRVLFCSALGYLFRALCVTLLQVPVPSEHTYCAPKSVGGASLVAARVARMFWSAGIEQFRARELCGDLIVSGHTLTIFTSLLAFKMYAPRKLQSLGHLFTVLSIVAVTAILLNRKHYSIDVVLGYVVSTRIFMEYHALANSFHDGTLERNPLWWSVWAKLIPFLERDAPPPHLFVNALEAPECLNRFTRYCS